MKNLLNKNQRITHVIIFMFILSNYPLASENEDEMKEKEAAWIEVTKSLEKLHISSVDKNKFKISDGDVYIVCKEIFLDNRDIVKSYYEFSYVGGVPSVIQKKQGEILKSPAFNLNDITKSVLEELDKVTKEKPAKYPEIQAALQAFGGKSSSVIIVSSENTDVYIRLGGLVDGFDGGALGRIINLLKMKIPANQ